MKTNPIFSILAVLVIFGLCGFASAEGLVAHWKLDETSGSTAYDSADGFDGALVNGPVWTAGQIDGALSFDGTQAVYIDGSAGHDSTLNIYNTNMTISAWIKPGLNACTVIARAKPHYTTYRLYIDGGKVGINTYNSPVHWDLLTGKILDPNNWYHIVGVLDRDNDTGIIYVNGVEQARSTQMTTDPPSCDAPTKIGCRNNIGDYTFTGLIDDVRIYDCALDANEVWKLYQPTPPCEPVAHWKFDETSGKIAYDSAGSNNGTVIGATWTTGIIGGALNFNAGGNNVRVADSAALDPVNAFTLSVWANPTRFSGEGTISGNPLLTKWGTNLIGQYMLSAYTGGNLDLRIANGSAYDKLSVVNGLTTNSWQHIVAEWNGSYMRLYINGELKAEKSTTITSLYNYDYSEDYLDIGYGVGGAAPYWNFKGSIDDVRIYNCALDANEIAEIYAEGIPDLQSIEIIGPNSVPEESDTQYHVIGYYDNGSSADITDDVNFAINSDEFAVIDANGLLETFRLYRLQENCSIYAERQGLSDLKPITIYPLCDGNECTVSQLFSRNINDVIGIKQGIREDLDYAMKIERASSQLSGEIIKDKNCRISNRIQFSKARLQLLSALIREQWADKEIDKSIDLLESIQKIPGEKPNPHR